MRTKPRILVCSCCNCENRKRQMWDILSSHEKYASKFDGIDSVLEIRHTDKRYAPHWEKILVLADHMDDGYDYLMWIDDDAGFIRFDEDFRDKLPTDGKRFYFTQEREWFEGRIGGRTKEDLLLNTGVFLVKCCEENKAVLRSWYDKRDTGTYGGLYDQHIIICWYLANKDVCGLLDPVVFNAFPRKPANYPTLTTKNIKGASTIIEHVTGEFKRGKYAWTKDFGCSAIVALTSYGGRLKSLSVPSVLESIVEGTIRPKKIVLTLAKADSRNLRSELRAFIDDGTVELLVADEDLRPHLKYYYAMRKYPDSSVITIDDDLAYPADLVESLYMAYLANPDAVCARRAHELSLSPSGSLNGYGKGMKWECKKPQRNECVITTGCGGVLFPPNFLPEEDGLLEVIKRHPTVDDIVLSWLRIKQGIRCVVVDCDRPQPPRSIEAPKGGLWEDVNRDSDNNDRAIAELIAPIVEPRYKKPAFNSAPWTSVGGDDWED